MSQHNATIVVTQIAAEQQFTPLQLGVIISIMWIGVVVLILGLYYLNKKYPSKKGKLDPIYKGVFLVLLVVLTHLTFVAVGALPQDSIQNNLWAYGFALAAAIGFYAVTSYYSNRVIPSHKLWKDYVLPEIKRFWNAEPYIGKGYGMAMTFYQVIEGNKKQQVMQELGVEEDVEKVQVFMGKVYFANIFEYMAVANKKTGEILRLQERPPLSQKQDLTKRDFMSSEKKQLEEYDTKPQEEVSST